MGTTDYDLFVIGGGSGGVRAARIAASHGARVAMAEHDRVGGTCVIRGCVPKKLFVYASGYAEAFEDAAGFGWTVGEPSFDWQKLLAAKDAEVARLSAAYIGAVERQGGAVIHDHAAIAGPGRVRLAQAGREVTAAHILLATGSHPFVPPDVPGAELGITSDDAFRLPALPQRIAIVGGGYVAVEFAGIFHGLGVETTLVYRGPRVLRGFDDDIRLGLMDEMKKKGVLVRCGTNVTGVSAHGAGRRLTLTSGDTLDVDSVMFATGRRPNTAGIGLEALGVALDANGAVKVDPYSRSSVPGIYAVGDVTNRLMLTPSAIREGHALADTLFGGKDTPVDLSIVPTAVFSQPEIGAVGLTEAAALQKHPQLDVYRARFKPMRHTLSGRNEATLMKILVDRPSDKVLGVHILGPHAGELIQMAGIALGLGATKQDFDRTLPVHPTAAEELVTMRKPVVRHGV